jgi:putative ABC transport system ATP-binding protein
MSTTTLQPSLSPANAPAPVSPTPAVELDQVERTYGKGDSEVHALRRVSLSVAGGEFIAIMGPSGSGKSTMLNLVGALDRPSGGRILAGGRDIAGLSVRDAARYRRREVGFVFQSFNLLPRLTVLENVVLPLMFEGTAPAERDRKARGLLGDLGLAARLRHKPGTLSGGEKQRVAIARALANDPRVLLADEPTGNLDSRNAEAAMELLVELNRSRGQTIFLITHEADVARHAGRIVHMRDGSIVDDGSGY